MDANLITVLAGVLGSVAGASAAIATTWISQKSQTVRQPHPPHKQSNNGAPRSPQRSYKRERQAMA